MKKRHVFASWDTGAKTLSSQKEWATGSRHKAGDAGAQDNGHVAGGLWGPRMNGSRHTGDQSTG
jgi:hypothetical protein